MDSIKCFRDSEMWKTCDGVSIYPRWYGVPLMIEFHPTRIMLHIWLQFWWVTPPPPQTNVLTDSVVSCCRIKLNTGQIRSIQCLDFTLLLARLQSTLYSSLLPLHIHAFQQQSLIQRASLASDLTHQSMGIGKEHFVTSKQLALWMIIDDRHNLKTSPLTR